MIEALKETIIIEQVRLHRRNMEIERRKKRNRQKKKNTTPATKNFHWDWTCTSTEYISNLQNVPAKGFWAHFVPRYGIFHCKTKSKNFILFQVQELLWTARGTFFGILPKAFFNAPISGKAHCTFVAMLCLYKSTTSFGISDAFEQILSSYKLAVTRRVARLYFVAHARQFNRNIFGRHFGNCSGHHRECLCKISRHLGAFGAQEAPWSSRGYSESI